MKNIIIIVSAFVFFISCQRECKEPDLDGNLTAAELSWLSYSGGEVLIFKSNSAVIDTLDVRTKVSNYEIIPDEGKEVLCHHKYQYAKFNITNNNYLNFTLYVSHHNQWHPEGGSILYTGSESALYLNYFRAYFSNYTPQNNILINGHSYNDVFVVSIDTTSFSSQKIWRIYYTKQNGILRYDLTQGEFWEKIN